MRAVTRQLALEVGALASTVATDRAKERHRLLTIPERAGPRTFRETETAEYCVARAPCTSPSLPNSF